MTSISEIARDPRKAMENLEKSLGVGRGTLIREMQQLADEIGDWTQHIPYDLAASYYDSSTARERYRCHVDGCTYCQSLLESLHPTGLQTTLFVREAVRARSQHRPRRTQWRPIAIAASVSFLLAGLASLFVVPTLQTAGILDIPAGARSEFAYLYAVDHEADFALLKQALRTRSSLLSQLQASRQPAERFRAAKYYFATNEPQLAYQQIGAGLQLAGLHPADAKKITMVADLPSDESAAAADLTRAAQQLPRLQAAAQPSTPNDFLDLAKAQATLGLHGEALASIKRYAMTQHVDPKAVANLSSVARPKPTTPVPTGQQPQTSVSTTVAAADPHE